MSESIYKQSKGPRGRWLYFRNGKMISKNDIPEHILAGMEPEKPVSDQAPEFRRCLFCAQPATEEKWLNGRLNYLCLDDYQTKTTGELAEKVKESVANPA